MSNVKKKWSKNLSEEKKFWRSLAGKTYKKKPEWIKEFHSRAEKDAAFPKKLDKFLPENLQDIKILDVGAGPITQLGSIHEWRKISIVPVDPLAEYYRSLFSEFDIKSARAITQVGEAENLSKQFSQEYFDLVYSRNALDHSYDPVMGIKEMIKVCKVGASCYILGSVNEGKKNWYRGLHKWNFEPSPGGDDLIIWNRKTKLSLAEVFSESVKISTSGKNWFNARLLRLS